MITYTEQFTGIVRIKKDDPENNKFKTEHLEKKIYYNVNNENYYTRYRNLIFSLYRISFNCYGINQYITNFEKGIFKKVKAEV